MARDKDKHILRYSGVPCPRGSHRCLVHACRGLVGTGRAHIRDAGGRGEPVRVVCEKLWWVGGVEGGKLIVV